MKTSKAESRAPALKRAHVVFVSVLMASSILFFQSWRALFLLGLRDDSYSQVLLVPFISLFLLFVEKKRFLCQFRPSISVGVGTIVGAVLLYVLSAKDALTFKILAVTLVWSGGFIAAYGVKALRSASFPFLLLLMMIPPPAQLIDWVIRQLQEGSTDVSYFLFNIFGVPVLRKGFVLALPSVTIEVAAECSGIRSSIALLITCVLAAHMYIRTFWKNALFVSLVLPLVVIKNGIRIVTLTMLSIYVNPGFLTGRLHHEGGIVFFIVALVLMFPVFAAFEKSERTRHISPLPPAFLSGSNG
jgi:exosortase